MNPLCEGAVSFLQRVYRDDIASFPFTTHVRGHDYKSVYTHSRTIRSTINCLLGMQEAHKHDPSNAFLQQAGRITARFLSLHEKEVENPGDLGLLLALLSEGDAADSDARRVLRRLIAPTSEATCFDRLEVQDVAWLLWGCVSAFRRGLMEAEPLAHRLFQVMHTRYRKPGEALPRHDRSRTRGGIVSFGASVYYANAVYRYGCAFGSSVAMDAFREAATALLGCQQAGGEWPWLLSALDGRPLDIYPVFSVHQHSMAMLVLYPAAAEGFPDIERAIERSTSWVSGSNQLGVPMLRNDPFFVYRSIERKVLWPRADRYVRARRLLATRQDAYLAPNNRVTINVESRSYELGWALYFLADRATLPGFD